MKDQHGAEFSFSGGRIQDCAIQQDSCATALAKDLHCLLNFTPKPDLCSGVPVRRKGIANDLL
ncbi:hypothetical protein [Micromonospora inositola]|uniref:Uncharacterized protein n=1 Tax=Micromonospora inositola TaxID=47865 RepID=A0A1C5JW92_9ACTN|nr:hypothetical protein [Micromonospora inositola]SCG74830.1 hypothetical protein GA0070613_5622 [Micromonospora inositola]